MDPNRYANPEVFAPERYLDHKLSASAYANSSDASARDHFAYGGGKRICVGIHLAERSLFSMTSRLLHAFNFKPALDAEGREIPVDVDDVVTALIMAPGEFPARFEVRSEAIAKLLDREYAERVEGIGESWDATYDARNQVKEAPSQEAL
jgi:cytochrome P450